MRGNVKKKKEWQKGQDLWSHLASNSFTFCSPQLNIRGPKGQGQGPGGRMSRLSLNTPAKPARLCGTLGPSFDNKGEGLTLARQPPVPGWASSLLKTFYGCLRGPCPGFSATENFSTHHTETCSGHNVTIPLACESKNTAVPTWILTFGISYNIKMHCCENNMWHLPNTAIFQCQLLILQPFPTSSVSLLSSDKQKINTQTCRKNMINIKFFKI